MNRVKLFPTRRSFPFLFFCFILIVGIFYLYVSIPSNNSTKSVQLGLVDEYEKELSKNREQLKSLRHQLQILKRSESNEKISAEVGDDGQFAALSSTDFRKDKFDPPVSDICMNDVYTRLTFDNKDGGVWKQGWNVRITKKYTSNNKLKVFIVPHSHCDAGWIKTIDKYYSDQVESILDNMVTKLSENPTWKFIFAEVSFLSMWWESKNEIERERLKRLLKSGQLEIVTGGWVMNDEANTHFTSMLEQMWSGHQWLKKHLDGYKPNFGWAIDPFGLSSTMAYILKRSGFDGMLIQRAHYAVKKELAKNKDLEFMWKQMWDGENSTQILTHLMPFYSYDVPHTCGPDPKICCQFDFPRSNSKYGYGGCPWGKSPILINSRNVAERSRTLIDQYRKKAELFKSDAVLIPLGDDFRYVSSNEWTVQFMNYEKIIDYVNGGGSSGSEFDDVHIQFATLSEYFEEVIKQQQTENVEPSQMMKSLTGDFFTYSDRNEDYWSGYYTSRPFYKNMDRILESYLRSSEILYSLSVGEMSYHGREYKALIDVLYPKLENAREALSFYQHHDGITGTAQTHVNNDYGKRMLKSIEDLQFVISETSNYLLSGAKYQFQFDGTKSHFDLNDQREHHYDIGQDSVIQLDMVDDKRRIVLFNSLPRQRTVVLKIRVNSVNICIQRLQSKPSSNVRGDSEYDDLYQDSESPFVKSQLIPVFDGEYKRLVVRDVNGGNYRSSGTPGAENIIHSTQVMNNDFHIAFLADDLPGLSLTTFVLKRVDHTEIDYKMCKKSVSTIELLNDVHSKNFDVPPFQTPQQQHAPSSLDHHIHISSTYLDAKFDKETGFLSSMKPVNARDEIAVRLSFLEYPSEAHVDSPSGAYLFRPKGDAVDINVQNPQILVVKGEVMSYVRVLLGNTVRHTVTLVNSPGIDGVGLHIENLVDVRSRNNKELIMRMHSSHIDSADVFYTDLNGFQMIKRKYLKKLPIQANYYPIPSMIYIEDQQSRLSLITKQPLGGSSLSPGSFEIMMDRRLAQDDNRGIEQSIRDNYPTKMDFYLTLQMREEGGESGAACQISSERLSYPTLSASSLRDHLLNPVHTLLWTDEKSKYYPLNAKYTMANVDPISSCDINLLNLRTTSDTTKGSNNTTDDDSSTDDKTALMLHRVGFDPCFKGYGLKCSTNGGKISLESILGHLFESEIQQTSLTSLYDGKRLDKSYVIALKPMEIYTFLLEK